MTKKKVYQVVSAILLVLFSFFYTDKSILFIRENDPIMKKIRKSSAKYKVDSVNAKIVGKKIIPGKAGKKINYKESYNRMKQYGSYNEILTVFEEVLPSISTSNNYDKYITSGNSDKKEITLVFRVNKITNLENILKILEDEKVKGTFFIDGFILENNKDIITKMMNQEVELLSYNNKYDEITFTSSLNYLNSITHKDSKYCYSSGSDDSILKLCSKLKLHTIIPTIIVDNKPFIKVKQNLRNSMIIELPLSKSTVSELGIVIKYIRQKGYKIVTLDKLLDESVE